MDTFLAGLPKAELHVHIEGTIEPELALSLAERNGVQLPWTSSRELERSYAFTDLQSFLDVYYQVSTVLRTRSDFTAIADAYLARAAGQGVRHAEIFFDPQAHTARGLTMATVVEGLYEATSTAPARHGLTAGLILCFMRDRPVDEAAQTLQDALPFADKLIGVGLDSAEVGHPPSLFETVFATARAAGLHAVAHAGEEGPADYVRQALDLLHVERIDHGLRALDDDVLVARLVAQAVPLTVCPLSTVRLRGVPSLAEHPLARMLRHGLNVSVHSDDPAYFGGYVGDAFEAIHRDLDLTDQELHRLAANSFRSSFLPDDTIQDHLRHLADYIAHAEGTR